MFNSLTGTQTPAYKVWDFSGNNVSGAVEKISLEDDCAPVQIVLFGTRGVVNLQLPSNPAPGKIIQIVANQNNAFTANPQVNIYGGSGGFSGSDNLVGGLGSGQSITLMYAPEVVLYAPSSTSTGSIKWINLGGGTFVTSSSFYGFTGSASLSGAYNGVRPNQYGSVVCGGLANYVGANKSVTVGGSNNSTTGGNAFIGGGDNNVSSGNYSTITGGQNHSATATGSFIGGGDGNTAAGSYSFVGGGQSNYNSGSTSVICGGTNNQTTTTYASVFSGDTNYAQGYHSVVLGGRSGTADGQYSTIVGGAFGQTWTVDGRVVTPACFNPTGGFAGASQTSLLVVGRETVDNTPTVMTSTSSAASSTTQLYINTSSAYSIRGTAVAFCNTTGDAKEWSFTCLLKRDSGGTTSIVGSPSVTSTFADTGAASWSLAISADTTNNALAVTVTGDATNTIRTTCRLDTIEVKF